ncbi:degenerin mec-10-like [Lytechinus pictus]|uniref:degenerin mec-10-like n=1 Tax=Lytechinus pictus TaxID=7653 RepID=UPI0030BA172B
MEAQQDDGNKVSWDSTPARKEESLRKLIDSRMEVSSAHGVPNIQRASHPTIKLAWTVIFLAGTGVMTWQVVALFQAYFAWNYTVNLEVKFNRTQDFPAITICNTNPMRKSGLETKDSKFQEIFDLDYNPSTATTEGGNEPPISMGSQSGSGPPEGQNERSENVQDWAQRVSQPLYYNSKSLHYARYRLRQVALANKSIEERISLGHSLDDMLLDCSWKGIPCSPENFTQIYDSQLGNCYTFNSGQHGEQLNTHRPGSYFGLSLELFVEQDEYVEGMTQEAGFRVKIHHPSNMPFPAEDGILISPGFNTAIGLRMLELDRLPDPYGDCKADLSEDIADDLYHQHYNITYNRKTCEVSCYQNEVIRRCGCFDASYLNSLNVNRTIYPCEYTSPVETQCMADIEWEQAEGELGCNCPIACHETTYLSRASSSIWPANAYESLLFKRMALYNDVMRRHVNGENASEWTRQNLAKLEVYYDEFNYEYIRQVPAYTIPDLLSDIGGQLGLWLGLSVITIFELLEGAWLILAFVFTRCGNSTKGGDVYPKINTVVI